MTNKVGRPPAGVPKKNVDSFIWCIEGWITKRILPGWLKEIEKDVEAIEAYEALSFRDIDIHEQLTVWCRTWLSDGGWKRLQANARQKRYKNKEQLFGNGPKFKRVSMERETALDLEHYAKSHDMTVTESVQHLLNSVKP